MTPELVPVTSSNIRAIGFDEGGPTLYVQFIGKNKPDSTYAYADFPHDQWVEFLRSPSKRSWFAGHVKGRYQTTKVS